MSESESKGFKIPYDLSANFSLSEYKSGLSKPYDLIVEYKTDGGSVRAVNVYGFLSARLGDAVASYNQFVTAIGVESGDVPTLAVELKTRYIGSLGFDAAAFGRQKLKNFNQSVFTTGFDASVSGRGSIYNLLQYQPIRGFDSSGYGKACLIGGVRYLYQRGHNSSVFGTTDTLNTTADQSISTKSFKSSEFANPNVSPRIIYSNGVSTLSMGVPDIRTPVLSPVGFNHSSYGEQVVWFHTRSLSVKSINAFISGYPVVFDPTQFLLPLSFAQSAVFGDTDVKNKTFIVKPISIYDSVFTPWAVVENSDRIYQPLGIDSQAIGESSVRNNTPSLFVEAVKPNTHGVPAVGYKIRSIKASGFDRLQIGISTITKTPELKPEWRHEDSAFSKPTVWFKNREVNPKGYDALTTSQPRAWFRYRSTTPNSWLSEALSQPTVTHGVREIIALGFLSEQPSNNAWASHGVRHILPKSIYTKSPTNHFVGHHQEIKPQGYAATLWGERIIPDIQAVYPQGFAGVFGLSVIDNFMRYISPASFISVGNQPADRWGWQTVFNQTQYIGIEVTEDSGLVPPKWAEWQSIENRNKAIGAVGTLSQKFGYNRIGNNAAPLLPKGIEPTPPSQTTMIAYSMRRLMLDGISPPPVSYWGVVYNGARVINPSGVDAQAFGVSNTTNTRRYYKNIGRIESQEFGTLMIADAIRTIDIEPRYSIAPPQINLPTVDLYTRYVTFRGYETAGYGLPSLSIHLRVIAPKWIHRDKAGAPALKNLTPELGVYGHNSDEYGYAQIRTEWREVIAQGDNSNVFGLLKISDTKQSIEVRGLQSGVSSQRHTVTKTGTNPYVVQNIWLNNESDNSKDGFGIPTDIKFFKDQVPKPSLNQNVIYPEGKQSSKFGTIFMWSNNLMIDGGIGFPDAAVPNPMVSNKDRVIAISEGMDYTIEVSEGVRLSPHTIYAVMDAPAQAIANHKASRLHYVNSDGGSRQPGEVFGRAFVESTIRAIKPRWSSPSSQNTIGRPTLTLSLAVVKPDSFRLSRFGVPSIPFTPQSIVVRAGVYDNVFGVTGVKRPPYTGPQTVNARGVDTLAFGNHYADNYIRTLTAKGSNSLVMGASKYNDTPFMWQGLRIGERVPLIIGGGDMALYGEHRISYWVQEVLSEGFESFRSEYSLESFYDRMTVKNADKKLPALLMINAAGIDPASAIGYQDIKYGQHYIRPDGNSDQFRKGGYHA